VTGLIDKALFGKSTVNFQSTGHEMELTGGTLENLLLTLGLCGSLSNNLCVKDYLTVHCTASYVITLSTG
jgi:hypothetical protein